MPQDLLGRTNRGFPPIWLRLEASANLSAQCNPAEVAEAAIKAGTVIDVTGNACLWGEFLRGHNPLISLKGGLDIENATDAAHAQDLMQAELIQTLSSLGRESLDFFFLRVRKALKEHQVDGALEALEMALQEGHIKHLGIACECPPAEALGLLQFRDAFEVLLTARNHHDQTTYNALMPLARSRRIGVVTEKPLDWGYGIPFTRLPSQWRLTNLTQSFYGLTLAQAVIADLAADNPVIIGVRTPSEVRDAVAAPTQPRPQGLDAMLHPFREAFESEEEWKSMEQSGDAELNGAARRRQAGAAKGVLI